MFVRCCRRKRNGCSALQWALSFSPFNCPSKPTAWLFKLRSPGIIILLSPLRTVHRSFSYYCGCVQLDWSQHMPSSGEKWPLCIFVLCKLHCVHQQSYQIIRYYRVLPRAPNILLHMKRPPHLFKPKRRQRRSSLAGELVGTCSVCGKAGCNRHQATATRKPYLNVRKTSHGDI